MRQPTKRRPPKSRARRPRCGLVLLVDLPKDATKVWIAFFTAPTWAEIERQVDAPLEALAHLGASVDFLPLEGPDLVERKLVELLEQQEKTADGWQPAGGTNQQSVKTQPTNPSLRTSRAVGKLGGADRER